MAESWCLTTLNSPVVKKWKIFLNGWGWIEWSWSILFSSSFKFVTFPFISFKKWITSLFDDQFESLAHLTSNSISLLLSLSISWNSSIEICEWFLSTFWEHWINSVVSSLLNAKWSAKKRRALKISCVFTPCSSVSFPSGCMIDTANSRSVTISGKLILFMFFIICIIKTLTMTKQDRMLLFPEDK